MGKRCHSKPHARPLGLVLCRHHPVPAHCDGDIDNDGSQNAGDLPVLAALLNANDPLSDIDCDGSANAGDLQLWADIVTESPTPGPSGLACAGTIPCE